MLKKEWHWMSDYKPNNAKTMNVVQIKLMEFEDLLDSVYRLEKRLDKIDEKLSGRSIEYVPLNQALKTLGISRKTSDNWHKQKILSKKYIGAKVFYSTNDIKKILES
jgi:hypothetical protein